MIPQTYVELTDAKDIANIQKTLDMLEQIGITCEEMRDKSSRKLIFVNEELKLRFFLAKGPDVPTYVEYGAADIGVTGKDIILEEGNYMKSWTQVSVNAACASADRRVPESFYIITS